MEEEEPTFLHAMIHHNDIIRVLYDCNSARLLKGYGPSDMVQEAFMKKPAPRKGGGGGDGGSVCPS